jgi:hypothetical protein
VTFAGADHGVIQEPRQLQWSVFWLWLLLLKDPASDTTLALYCVPATAAAAALAAAADWTSSLLLEVHLHLLLWRLY